MKTTLCILPGVFVAIALQAQDETYSVPAPSPAIVYQSTVTYQVPVVYQAPVIYQAPVSFQAPVSCQVATAPQYPSTPEVVYVAGPGSYGANYCNYPRYSGTQVIFFGGGEAYQRGYHFGHRR